MAVLPPAPNWFSAQILRSSDKGYVAFGAKNSVVVLKCRPQIHFTGEKNISNSENTVEVNGKFNYLVATSPVNFSKQVLVICVPHAKSPLIIFQVPAKEK